MQFFYSYVSINQQLAFEMYSEILKYKLYMIQYISKTCLLQYKFFKLL